MSLKHATVNENEKYEVYRVGDRPTWHWKGYCEYSRVSQRYRWWNPESYGTPPWLSLSLSELEKNVADEKWALEVPPEMQLPEGF